MPWLCLVGLSIGLVREHATNRDRDAQLAAAREESQQVQALRAELDRIRRLGRGMRRPKRMNWRGSAKSGRRSNGCARRRGGYASRCNRLRCVGIGFKRNAGPAIPRYAECH
jgi:hypothetical protein